MNNTLLERYRIAAVNHGQGTLSGDYKEVNKSHDALSVLFNEMCECGTDCELLTLLDDVDVSVRTWAAAHTLETNEAEALTTLRFIAKSEKSILGMNARITAEEWEKGNLRFRDRGQL